MAGGIKVKALFVSLSHPLCNSKGDFFLKTNENPAIYDDGAMPEISALFHGNSLRRLSSFTTTGFYLLIKFILNTCRITRQKSVTHMSFVIERKAFEQSRNNGQLLPDR